MNKNETIEEVEKNVQPKYMSTNELRILILVMSAVVAVVLTFSLFIVFCVDIENISINYIDVLVLSATFLLIFVLSYFWFSKKIDIEERECEDEIENEIKKLSTKKYIEVKYRYKGNEALTKVLGGKEAEFYAKLCDDMIEVQCRDKCGNVIENGSWLFCHEIFFKNFEIK